MPITNISLGEIEHLIRHLKVVSTGNVTLSSSEGSVHPFLVGSWLNFGTSFKIIFSFCFNGIAIKGGDLTDHVENLGSVLQNAEVPFHQVAIREMLSVLASCGPNCYLHHLSPYLMTYQYVQRTQ